MRFAAVYSGWCEHAPLDAFLETLGREIAPCVDGVLRLGCDEWQDVLDLDREG